MRSRVLLLALVACKRDPGGNGAFGALPDPKVTILDEGSGPENLDLLEPATAGYRASSQFDYVRWMGALDAGRSDVIAQDTAGGNQPGAPSAGRGTGLHRWTDDGLVLQALDRPLDDTSRPTLVVPTVVRVGMSWESDLGDGSFNRRSVVRHTSAMLPTGPSDLWAIAEEYPDGGEKVTRWYAEGVGFVGTSGGGVHEWSPTYGFDAMVVPMTPQDHVELGLDPARLTSVLAVSPPQEIWGVSGAVIDGVLWAYLDGENIASGYTRAWPHDWCARLDDSPQLIDVTWAVAAVDAHCPTYTWSKPDEFGYGSTPVQEVANAGQLLPGLTDRVPLDGAGAVAPAAGNSMPVTLTGWAVGGVAHTLVHQMLGNPPAQFFRTVPDPVNPVYTALTDGLLTRAMFLDGRQDDPMGVGYSWSALVGQTWIGPAAVDSEATVHFAVLGLDGQLFRVTLTNDTLSGFVPVGVLPGAVSILLDGNERIADSITTDGRVFEARIDQTTGEVAITALGSVRVEEPGGAYEFKGVLVDPTHPGDVVVAAIATSATSVPFYQTGFFRARLEQTPVPLVTAPSMSVAAGEILGGIAVCWPASDEPFDGEGWTLRGEPVQVVGPVGPDGNCAILLNDPSAPADANWTGSERAIEATVPGVGAVRLGFPAGRYAGTGLNPSLAVLNDGSVIDVAGDALDRDGFPLSRTYTGWQAGIRDLGGYGLWVSGGPWEYSTTMRNIGGGIPMPPCPSTEPWVSCTYGGPVQGGGALFALGGPQWELPPPVVSMQVIRPDGTVEDLPAAQTADMVGGSS